MKSFGVFGDGREKSVELFVGPARVRWILRKYRFESTSLSTIFPETNGRLLGPLDLKSFKVDTSPML
jgi:hypothetical protein